MTVIDDIKQKTDIIQVIGQYTKLSKAGRMYRGLCPFHSEKDPSFYVYPEQQTWHCFGACSTGGDVFSFLMKKEGLGFREALEALAERAGVELPAAPGHKENKEEKQGLYEANTAAAQFYHAYLLTSPAAQKARDYAASRGFTRKSVEDFQIGLSTETRDALKQHLLGKGFKEEVLLAAGLIIQTEDGRRIDRFHGRLMFPIRDIKGQTTGFGARALDDSQPKYLNSPQTAVFDKSGGLYAIDLAAAAIRKQDVVIIVEGYIDAIICHQHQINHVVASMGTSITDKQVATLKRLTRNVVLALDPDAAGEEAMRRCVSYESIVEAEIKVMSLPEGQDPDEVLRESPGTWDKAVQEARPAVDCTFESLLKGLDLTRPGDKQLALDRLMPVIAGITQYARQGFYTKKLANLLGMRTNDLEAKLKISSAAGKPTGRGGKATDMPVRISVNDRWEEDCLALLLQHAELKCRCGELSPDYFQRSESREIFLKYQQVTDPSQLQSEIDPLILDQLERLKTKPIPSIPVDDQFNYYSIHLRERYIKNLEARRADILALAAEAGEGADLARLKQDGIQNSIKLREIHKTLGKR